MITQIGIVAGEILSHLDKKGTTPLEEITAKINKPCQLILMSLGWLARENFIKVSQSNDKYIIELKNKGQKIEQ